MFDEVDRAFFQRRAKEERERAAAATDITAIRIYQELAREYERKAEVIAKPVGA